MHKKINKADSDNAPDPEVTPVASRRTFTGEYKLRILKEVEEATERGDVGAVLRREGLYSSHLTKWREERERASLEALGKKRGRKATPDAVDDEVEKLRREVARLTARLAQAEMIIDIQKKVSSMLGIPLTTAGSAS